MTNHLLINGEEVPRHEALALVRMLCNDAKQIAGEFHSMNRSAKFRANWPNEYNFAEKNWRNFMEAARAMYAQRLGDPKTPPEDARKIHLALVIDSMAQKAGETDNRLQLAPGTQQFEGDRRENTRIMEQFGPRQNLRAFLLGSCATRH